MYAGYSSVPRVSEPAPPKVYGIGEVNFADAADPLAPKFLSSPDPMALDPDIYGTRTVEYGRANGYPYGSNDVIGASVFGRGISEKTLRQSEDGRRLLGIMELNRLGVKRDFIDAMKDWGPSDVPFLSLFATVGKSISDAKQVSDTMRKIQNGEACTDAELIKTRLYMAENERRTNGTWGAMVGDLVRAAPGFMTEFLLTGGMLSAARGAAVRGAAELGIHVGATRGAKILARESTEYLVKDAMAKSAGKAAADVLADKALKKSVTSRVATQMFGFLKRPEFERLYKGIGDDALLSMAERRAAYEYGMAVARNSGGAVSRGFSKFTQWLGQNMSRGLMDYGAWGTEEATVAFTRQSTAGRALADAIGTFVVEAPLKGGVMILPQQLLVKPVVGGVSASTLSLQTSALVNKDKQLMDDAEAVGFGMDLMEYVSENTGRGLKSLLSAGGIALEKVGVKGLVRPLAKQVTELGGVRAIDDNVSIGGKMRRWIADTFGTREQYLKNRRDEALDIMAARFNASPADRAALQSAIMSNTTTGLRREIADAVGPDVGKYVDKVLSEEYGKKLAEKQYKAYARFAVANWMTKNQVGPETVMNMFERMGYDGVLGEMFEERYSDVVKGLLGFDERRDTKWFTEEHDFFSNLKEAVKGIYPGWDQLLAEAVGFSVPMVTRAGILRLQSAIGGEGKLAEIRAHLNVLDDALRSESAVRMTHGQYLKAHQYIAERDAAEMDDLVKQRSDAEAAGDKESAGELTRKIDTLRKVMDRRAERHQKFLGSLSDQAKDNLDAMVVVPMLSNETLADDDLYARTPALNSDQANESLAGQAAIVDYAPELARHMFEAERQHENETNKWYRKAAHRIVGIAGALVTGDMSLAASNPVQWTARDMGLSLRVTRLLGDGFRETYDKVCEEMVAKNVDAGSAFPSSVSVSDAMDEAQRRFSERARNIMSSEVAMHQLRSFAEGRMRDQAIAHVASTYTETDPGTGEERSRPYQYSVDKDGNVTFYRLSEDGSAVDESSVMTADEFYEANREKVDKAHEGIVKATVDLLTRGIRKADTAARVANAVTMDVRSDMLDVALYDAAMHLVGEEGLVKRVRVDGRTPLDVVMKSRSVARVDERVLRYISGKQSVDQVDDRAFESVAHAMNLKFDGTETGLADRNRKIFNMAKLANALTREGVVLYSKEIAGDDMAERLSSNGRMPLRAVKNSDQTYTVDFGYVSEGDERGKRDTKTYVDKAALDKALRELGYSEDTANIVLTQAQIIESDDMFHMIRELGLARVYRDRMAEAAGEAGKRKSAQYMHPMLRTDRQGKPVPVDDEVAEDGKFVCKGAARVLREELAAAEAGRHADIGTPEREAYEKVWGKNGYMTIGEALLEENQVRKNSASTYTGVGRDYGTTLYTLSLKAGRMSRNSSDVYVPVDPLVNPDIASGLVSALLSNAYAYNSRLLSNHLNNRLADFIHDLDGIIDRAIAKAAEDKDRPLEAALRTLRSLCTAKTDKLGKDGKIHRGAGMSHNGFLRMAANFVLFQAENDPNNPDRRAVNTIAQDVRQLPSFMDFVNVVDIVLGGNGFLSETVRESAKQEADPAVQRGVQQVLSYATGDPEAFKKMMEAAVPFGMTYRQFLEGCVEHLDSMCKGGVGPITEKDREELRKRAADAESRPEQAFSFIGNVIGVVRGALKSDKVVAADKSFAGFMRHLANVALSQPGVTDRQRARIERELRALEAGATVDAREEAATRYLATIRDLKEKKSAAEARIRELVAKNVMLQAQLDAAIKGGNSAAAQEAQDGMESVRNDIREAEEEAKKADDELSEARSADEDGDIPETLDASSSDIDEFANANFAEPEDEDGEAMAVSFPVGYEQEKEFELPELLDKATGRPFSMTRGTVDSDDVGLRRSQARLACNLMVRATISAGELVTEQAVERRIREFFPKTLPETAVAAILDAFRVAQGILDSHNLLGGDTLTWDRMIRDGHGLTLTTDEKDDEGRSSDNFNEKSLAEYNNESVTDFLALAKWIMPDAGSNLQAFLRLNREAVRSGTTEADVFMRRILVPRMDPRGATQAEHSALLLEALEDVGSVASGYVRSMLAREGGRPRNAAGAFLLTYLSSLPTEARTRFGVLCANSVSATPIAFDKDSGVMTEAMRASAGKIPESLVTDSFSDLLGKSSEECSRIASELEAAAKALGESGRLADMTLEERTAAVADLLAAHFGKSSPLYRVLTSELAASHRRTLPDGMRKTLNDAVSYRQQREGAPPSIAVVDTVASALRTIASLGGTVSRSTLSSVFTSVFATGPSTGSGLRSAPSTCYATDPLMSFFSTFVDSLPVTIMSARIDQTRDRQGSSVAVAPRDLVPLVARWLYADDKTQTVIRDKDGKETRIVSFREACKRFFGVDDEKVIAECRQNATWPDAARTPVCAKCLSTSLSAREVYDACEATYRLNPMSRVYWVPLYAGDHSSSTLFQIPREVTFADMAEQSGKEQEKTDVAKSPSPTQSKASGRTYVQSLAKLLEGVEDRFDRAQIVFEWKKSNPGISPYVETDEQQDPIQKTADQEAEEAFDTYVPKKEKKEGPTYAELARRASDALGMNLLFTDAKRAAVSSLEAQGTGLVGHETTPDGNDRYGEHRVHILCSYAPNQNNESFLGSTYMSGYGARALKTLSRDSESSTVKAHIVSTYGYDLFFAKSLCLATDPANGDFLEGSAGRTVMDYIRSYRGNDALSTDLFTDFDSYKVGPAGSTAIKAVGSSGEAKLMEVVFERLRAKVGASRESKKLTEAQASKMKSMFSKMTGDELDAAVGTLTIRDYARDGGREREAKLSEVLPGAVVNFVDGLSGPALDLSYREDGAMGYIVANVSHTSTMGSKPGKSPRNYEFDAISMAAMLTDWRGKSGGRFGNRGRIARTVMDMVANWGLVANTVYTHPNFRKSLVKVTEDIRDQILNGEYAAGDTFGQNIGEQLAKQVWAKIREASNLPLNAIDAPLVSCGAQIGKDGKLFTHVKSRMHRAMMKGSELFSDAESEFFGCERRMALCNVNCKNASFRYGWFLNMDAGGFEDQFGKVEDQVKAMRGNEAWTHGQKVAKAIAAQFDELRRLSDAAENAGPETADAAAKELHDHRVKLASSFLDHHGKSIASDGKYVDTFMFDDLYVAGEGGTGDVFDLSAVQFDDMQEDDPDARDMVYNDATKKYHVFLGGTMFGLPRTPSYNGSMWLQTVRAGLPVTEIEHRPEEGDEKAETTWEIGRDAMVSPDPFTNAILGCDHDGDKSKLYMFYTKKNGRVEFSNPPSPGDWTPGVTFSKFVSSQEVRNKYLTDSVAANKAQILVKCFFNEDTGKEEDLPSDSERPDMYYRISDVSRRRVGNAFARALFNMSRVLPTGMAVDNPRGMKVDPRPSRPGRRAKFIGGIASSPTGAFSTAFNKSIVNEATIEEAKGKLKSVLKENSRAGLLDPDHPLAAPIVAADVSSSGDAAANARASVVSFARTMLVAWYSGYFKGNDPDSLFPRKTTPAQFMRFMYRFDGISNATFDDLKEQLCARLGWSGEMIDTVLSDLIINSAGGGGRLPTTSDEFTKVIADYARDVRDKGASYYMFYSSARADPEGKDLARRIRKAFFGTEDLEYRITQSHAMASFGIWKDTDGPSDKYRVLPLSVDNVTPMKAVIHGLWRSMRETPDRQSRVLGAIATDTSRNLGYNPMLGRLYYLVTQAVGTDKDLFKPMDIEKAKNLVLAVSKMPEAKRFASWAVKRQAIGFARSFARSVSYLTADPGAPDAAGDEARVERTYALTTDRVSGMRGNGALTDFRYPAADGTSRTYSRQSMLDRMHAATVLAYRLGRGVRSVATSASKASMRRDEAIARMAKKIAAAQGPQTAQRLVAKLAVARDDMPGYDRIGLEDNARQVKYLTGFFVRQASLAARVAGTPFSDGRKLLDAADRMASGIAARSGAPACGLELRRAIEALWAINYELTVTSSEFNGADGNKAAAYIRSAGSDSAYGPKIAYSELTGNPYKKTQYGPVGDRLTRLMSTYRANDKDSVDRIRSMFGGVMSGRDYAGTRKLASAPGATRCRTFSLSVTSLLDYLEELVGRGAMEKSKVRTAEVGTPEFYSAVAKSLSEVAPSKAGKKGAVQESRRCADICDAFAALSALGGEITPAVLYGQLVPMYTLMTSRTSGVPSATGTSMLNLYPEWMYRELSEFQAELDRDDPDLSDIIVATNWSPVKESKAASRRKAKKLFSFDKAKHEEAIAKFEKTVTTGITLDDATDDNVIHGALKELRDSVRQKGDTDARENPDFRNTVDFLTDGLMGDLLSYYGDTSEPSAEPSPSETDTVSRKDAAYDEATARTAAVMGSLLASWATVEYAGGKTFVIRGKLRGNAGAGKTAVIVVDTSGTYGMCDTEEQVRALANDYAYGESLCAMADLGIDKDGFALLPESTRMALVRTFKVGAATANRVTWTSNGRGLATLVGSIRLPEGKGGTRIYHEYFHAMMRMFDQCGLFSAEDLSALQEKFGDEEHAAEAFRKWVQKNTDPGSKEARTVFQKIFDLLRAFFEALARGFDYRTQSEDMLFNMVVHGIAQASDSRKAEVAARSGVTATASVLKKAFVLKRHNVAGNGRMLSEKDLVAAQAERTAADRTETGSIEALEDKAGFYDPSRSRLLQAANEAQARAEAALAVEGDISPETLREVLPELVAARTAMAADMGVTGVSKNGGSSRFSVSDVDPDSIADRLDADRLADRAADAAARAADRAAERHFSKKADVPVGNNERRDAEVRAAVAGGTSAIRTEFSRFHAATKAMYKALESGLKADGSWNRQLQDVVNRYNCPTWNTNEDEARDRAALLNGIRLALRTANPKAAKELSDKTLADSLVFRAALVMYQSMESSFLGQTRKAAGTGTVLPANPAGNGQAAHASRFQVSAWMLSGNTGSPAVVIGNARDTVAKALGKAKGGALRKELRDVLGAVDKMTELVASPASMQDYRRNQGMAVMDTVIPKLRSMVTDVKFGKNGEILDFEPRDPGKRDLYASSPSLQHALKAALSAAYTVAAMAKFYQETDLVPESASDVEFHMQFSKRHNLPPHVTPAEWAASQAIGDSNLCDNTGLVDYMDQSMFIANNVDAWLSSLVRKSFGARGNIGQMLSDENHEYGAIKMKVANLENFFAMMFGNNVEAGGRILKVLEHESKFEMEDGSVVHKVGGKFVKFDNYNRKTCEVTMTEEDICNADMFLKMVASHAGGDWATVTGVDDLRFDRGMSRDESFYDRDAVRRRHDDGKQLNALEMACLRLTYQIPKSLLDGDDGLYNRFVRGCIEALGAADKFQDFRPEPEKDAQGNVVSQGSRREPGAAQYNSFVLDYLSRKGLVVAVNRENSTYGYDEGFQFNGNGADLGGYLPKYTKGTVVIANDEIDRAFRDSDTYAKLTDPMRGGRKAEWLDRDYVAGQFMSVWREAGDFVRRHPWLTHGDGKYFTAFGTKLPFWRGTGVFMYDAVRVDRDRNAENLADLSRDEAVMVKILRDPDASKKSAELAPDDAEGGSAMLDMLANYYGVEMHGTPFAERIAAGDFERGKELSEKTGLVLPRNATYADLTKAIYMKSLERAWGRELTGTGERDSAAQRLVDLYEESRQTAGEMFGGSEGLTDTQMYRMTGTLPANYQIGHKVHVAIDGITNAMMSRGVLANLLMTPAYDGAPVYYADPSSLARETSGLPDSFWDVVAKWWNDYNGLSAYDPAKSGVENAKAVYEAVRPLVQKKKGRKVGEGDDQSGKGKVSGASYEELSGSDGDIMSVDHWLVREDDQLGDDSSLLNALGGGEAKGYLKQFLHASRTLGFGGPAARAVLHRALSWSKSLSVSFSFFFPIATRLESPIGAVGSIATMGSNSRKMGEWIRQNPELFAGIQKMFGGKGWVTKDFLGFTDILDMMDSNDPFLAEMYSWASALGITVSTSLVNPMEPTKGIVAGDIAKLKSILRKNYGAEVAAKFGRIADVMMLRQGEKAFNYALNATKLAVVAQLAMKLRYAVQAKGKAFDPVRDLRRYSGYVNAEVGGIDPLRYAWAHPFNRGIMNTLMFSWQWTRGAWEAGGGNVIEDMLFGGHSVTKEERDLFLGRWARMFGAVMIGVPALMQMAVMLFSKCLYATSGGGGDDDDTWFTFRNESKTRWTACDITPLLRAIEKFDSTRLGGYLRKFKEGGTGATALAGGAAGAVLGAMGGNWLTGLAGGLAGSGVGSAVPSLVPMYTGNDAANSFSKHRRYYMHFGKQGWEFFRWFDDAKSQFMSKLSMPTQRILEGVFGRSLGFLDRSLPWEDMGQFERWIDPTTDGALFNLAEAFLPFSVGSMARNGDAGILPIFGPVQMGESKTSVQKRLEKALTAWARNDRRGYSFGGPRKYRKGTAGYEKVQDILRDAKLNGFDPEDQLNKALGQVLSREYGRFFKELPEDPREEFNTKRINEIARCIDRVGGKKANLMKSIKTRYQNQNPGMRWEKAPAEYRRYMEDMAERTLRNPFRSVDVPGLSASGADAKPYDY